MVTVEPGQTVKPLGLRVPCGGTTKCFMCSVDIEKNPEIAVNKNRYPPGLYATVFNHLAKFLCMRDSQKRIIHLSEERASQLVVYCAVCHGQVWQLYRLSTSTNAQSESTKQQIEFLKNMLMFKFAFSKRNNSKLKPLVTAHADPSLYSIYGYWHLRGTELKCLKQMYNWAELSATLADLDIQKLKTGEGRKDESVYFLVACDLDDEKMSFDGQYDDYSGGDDDDDDSDDIGMMVHTGRIAPIELVQVNMGNEFSSREQEGQNGSNLIPGSLSPNESTEVFHVPAGELKPPRKQILASRVGVSTKAPIIKTITRDHGVEVTQKGEPLPLRKVYPCSKEVTNTDVQPFTIEEVEIERPGSAVSGEGKSIKDSKPMCIGKKVDDNEVEIEDMEIGCDEDDEEVNL